MKLAYIAGPYTADGPIGIAANVRRAAEVAAAVAAKGYAIFCPHTNSYLVDRIQQRPYDYWLQMDLAFLERCDLLVLVPDWEKSDGTAKEIASARDNGIPVFQDAESVPPATKFVRDTTSMLVDLAYERRRKGVLTYPNPLHPEKQIMALKDVDEELFDAAIYALQISLQSQRLDATGIPLGSAKGKVTP
jgi:hypothetical protein